MLDAGDLLGATERLSIVLAERPRHPMANRVMSRVLLRMNDAAGALHHARVTLGQLPFDDTALFVESSALHELGRPGEASAALARAISTADATDPEPWRAVLRVAKLRQRRATTIAALERLLALGADRSGEFEHELALLRAPARPLPSSTTGDVGDIDAVYLWVDGSDPAWRARFRDRLGFDPSESRDRGHDQRRYEPHGELRFSLACLHRHAPWLRRIHVVTDEQAIDMDGLPDDVRSKVVVVDHREFIPSRVPLPTFNSSTIEVFVHLIPGIAEHFLFLNDDTVIGAPLQPSQLVESNGRIIIWVTPRVWGVPEKTRSEWRHRRNDSLVGRDVVAVDLYEQSTGHAPPEMRDIHQARMLSRSLCAEVLDRFDSAFRELLYPTPVRTREAPYVTHLWTWAALDGDGATPVTWEWHELFGLQPSDFSSEHARVLLEWRPPWFCLNFEREQRAVFDAFAQAYLSEGSATAVSLPADPLSTATGAGTKTWSR